MVRSAAFLGALVLATLLVERAEAGQPVSSAPPRSAAAEEADPRIGEEAWSPADDNAIAEDPEQAAPPPPRIVYFQYGVAFAAEHVAAPGPMCASTAIPCVLGDGGGIVVRAGWRDSGPLFLGLAYEVTKQDPNKLYRLALLQQARVEGRYYVMTARVTEPYITASAGVAAYGNEWSADTWGPSGSLGAGLEYQITRRTVVGVALAYRLLYFGRFTDTAGHSRSPGLAQLVGLDFVLEQRDALFTASPDHR